MGLFDLFAKSSTKKNPLEDPEIKMYFEIICGMRHTFLLTGEEKITGNEKAKRFVEYFLKRPCDEEKLCKALELYNLSRTDYPSGETARVVSEFRRSITKENARYLLDRYEATKMFHQTDIAEAKKAYANVLQILGEDANYQHYSQGVRKIPADSMVKSIVVEDSFYEANPVTEKMILWFFVDLFISRLNNSEYAGVLYAPTDIVAMIALKALHFEKHGKSKDEYHSVTEEDCRKAVCEITCYQEDINDHPFDKDEYIEKYTKRILKNNIFETHYSSYDSKEYYYFVVTNNYYGDAICNLIWKEIAKDRRWINDDGEDISNSQSCKDVFDILFSYLINE